MIKQNQVTTHTTITLNIDQPQINTYNNIKLNNIKSTHINSDMIRCISITSNNLSKPLKETR